MQELQDRVAVVTGSASGIGLGIATAFVDAGMKVVMADLDERRLGREADTLGSERVETVVCDVSDPDSVARLADAALERFGTVHVLCNNAGILRSGLAWELPLADWEAVIGVNLFGAVHGIRTFVPLMLASGDEGHVVNVGSMASVVPVAGIGPYNVAKHGVLALTDTLAKDFRRVDAPIGVTLVMPGRVVTRLGRPIEAPDLEAPPADAPPDPDVLPADEVGRQVVAAIRENRRYLFTHTGSAADAERRFGRITSPS
jgi:NAD(P)-dependent dehydrogenase (short-subunit alcohol dehydrogenase family)